MTIPQPTNIRLEINNICPDFVDFWAEARDQKPSLQKKLWHERYRQRHEAIFDVYFSRYGRLSSLDTALLQFEATANKVQQLAPQLTQQIERLAQASAQLFAADRADLQFVLLVGLFNSDAWVTELNGRLTTFLALEAKTNSRLSVLEVTIAHELAHAFHGELSQLKMNSTMVGEGLFLEGLAVLASTILVPERKTADYLCPGGNQTATGQDCAAWLAECKAQMPFLRQRLLQDLKISDENVYASYFWNRPQSQQAGIPLRSGYVVGYQLVKALHSRYSIAEMARWSPQQTIFEIRHALNESIGGTSGH
ncbi:MAG: DUF2268 domain-containing putative Zn-dependent protease [Chloroflexota bacterium]